MKKKASMKTFSISFLDLMPYSDSHSKKVFSEKSALDAAEEVKSDDLRINKEAIETIGEWMFGPYAALPDLTRVSFLR